MKIVVWLAALAILGGLSTQLYHLYTGNSAVGSGLQKTSAEVQNLKKENQQLLSDIQYYSEPENLAKELKSKFDYKKPGEKLIKIQ